jgi:hypothetical protein
MGASLLAQSFRNNALPNLSLYNSGIDDDGFIALVSALEQNNPLLHLHLPYNRAGLFGLGGESTRDQSVATS